MSPLKEVIDIFLGNNKYPDYIKIVSKVLQKFRALGNNMSLKLHFLFSHLGVFPENLGNKERGAIKIFDKWKRDAKSEFHY